MTQQVRLVRTTAEAGKPLHCLICRKCHCPIHKHDVPMGTSAASFAASATALCTSATCPWKPPLPHLPQMHCPMHKHDVPMEASAASFATSATALYTSTTCLWKPPLPHPPRQGCIMASERPHLSNPLWSISGTWGVCAVSGKTASKMPHTTM